jgi:hypothetical protein
MYEYRRPIYCDLVGEIVWFMAEEMARARHRRLKRPPVPRGKTLRPGAATPCWNLLAANVEPLLRRRGAKALLARDLGLNRGRMTDFFVNRSAMPDAERLLRLLEWYAWRLAEDRQRLLFRNGGPASPPSARATAFPPTNVRNTNIR